jgi:hypothetical protein
MDVFRRQKALLLEEVNKLHDRHELSKNIGPDYYEPGMMEYLDQSDGIYEDAEQRITLRVEVKGTRYEGRTEQIEKIKCGDEISVIRDPLNKYNPNNFQLQTAKKFCVGNLPAELCNAMAPLYDKGNLSIEHSFVSFVDPISKRSRYAKQAILFVEVSMILHPTEFA